MSVSTEIMDGAFGRAAEGVPVTLLREVEARWQAHATAVTDEAGRVSALETAPHRGRYRLVLDLDRYFSALGVEPFQSRIEVTFRLFDPQEDVHLLMVITATSLVTCRVSGK